MEKVIGKLVHLYLQEYFPKVKLEKITHLTKLNRQSLNPEKNKIYTVHLILEFWRDFDLKSFNIVEDKINTKIPKVIGIPLNRINVD